MGKISDILKNGDYGELLKGSGLVFSYRIFAAIITLLLTREITTRLGVEQSGYYFFIISLLMFLTSFTSFGLNSAVLKEVSINISSSSQVSNIMTKAILLVIIGFFIVTVLLLSYNYFGPLIGYSHHIINNFSFTLIICLFPFSLMFLFSNYFQPYKEYLLAILMMNLGYQAIMLSIVLCFNMHSLLEIFKALEVSLYLIILIAFIFYFFSHDNKIKLTNEKTFSSLLALSTPMMFAHIVSQINNFSGQLLLSIYSTPVEISLFSVAIRVGTIISFFFMAIIKVSAPKFAILYNEKKSKQLEELIVFFNKIIFFIAIIIFFVTLFFGKVILGLFGDEFVSAYKVLMIITLGQVIASSLGISVYVLQMTGFHKSIRNNVIIATIISLTGGVLIVPRWGIKGAAIMVFANLVLVNLLAYLKVKKELNINPLRLF